MTGSLSEQSFASPVCEFHGSCRKFNDRNPSQAYLNPSSTFWNLVEWFNRTIQSTCSLGGQGKGDAIGMAIAWSLTRLRVTSSRVWLGGAHKKTHRWSNKCFSGIDLGFFLLGCVGLRPSRWYKTSVCLHTHCLLFIASSYSGTTGTFATATFSQLSSQPTSQTTTHKYFNPLNIL